MSGEDEEVSKAARRVRAAFAGAVAEGNYGRALRLLGRNEMPLQVDEWWTMGRISREFLHEELAGIWSLCEWPQGHLGMDRWVELFHEAGVIVESGAAPPAVPFTAWRGATWGRRRGMAWTTKRETAAFFATRFGRAGGHT